MIFFSPSLILDHFSAQNFTIDTIIVWTCELIQDLLGTLHKGY